MHIYCEMILIVPLVNASFKNRVVTFFFVVRTFKIYSLSNFQAYKTVLYTIVTMVYIRSP